MIERAFVFVPGRTLGTVEVRVAGPLRLEAMITAPAAPAPIATAPSVHRRGRRPGGLLRYLPRCMRCRRDANGT